MWTFEVYCSLFGWLQAIFPDCSRELSGDEEDWGTEYRGGGWLTAGVGWGPAETNTNAPKTSALPAWTGDPLGLKLGMCLNSECRLWEGRKKSAEGTNLRYCDQIQVLI